MYEEKERVAQAYFAGKEYFNKQDLGGWDLTL